MLVCFNAPLKEYLSRVMNGLSVDVESFHSLVNREMKKANIRSSVHRNKEWFDQQSAGDLLDALRINGTVYDALLVDETQDFRIEWLEALLFMAKNEASIVYLFGDSHQDLYAREWIPPKDFAQFELTVNCRNTTPIAKKVCRIFGDDITCNAAQGPEPQFIEVQGIEQGIKQVSLILDRILNIEGLSPNQIVVLSDSKYLVDELRKTKIGDYNMTDLTGVGIPVETIYRFKGLEQDVVVLFLTDAAINSRIKQLAYVGLSRAKSILYILGSASIRRGFSWE